MAVSRPLVNRTSIQISCDDLRKLPQECEAAWLGHKDTYFTSVHGIKGSIASMSRADRL